MNKKNLFLPIAAIILLMGYGTYRYWLSKQPFVYAGTLETTKVIVSSKIASDITNFPVEEGDMVQKGDLILEMSCDNYKVLSHQIDNDYQRALALVQKGHMSQAQFDVLARNKEDNDLKLKWCEVEAPISGMIITKFREEGEVVAQGASLVSIANPYDIWAYFYVPHDELYRLKVGQKIIGYLPEAKNKPFVGKILKINEEAEFTPKNVQTREERTRLVYGVKVKFENKDLMLKSGMTIESALFDE
ncbi:MAG: HlyD family efflux transporter periplasmic adaptor subunit [Alphaproteobacteria bacterium]|nr:HlyD family efflux transporter periplasmic adaptor subunit [Alphaproteobacteria bacterium]